MHRIKVLIYEIVQSAIALLTVMGFLFMLGYSVIYGLPSAREGDQGMFLLIGALNTLLGAVCQTYFRQRDARADDRATSRPEQ